MRCLKGAIFWVLFAMGVLGAAGVCPAQPLGERIAKVIVDSPAPLRTRLSVYVVDAKTGEVIFDRDSGQLFTPASVLKTYTSACALDTFGADKRWKTKLAIRARQDLVLIAGGDAMFTDADLAALVKQAKDHGLSSVKGTVRVDSALFAPPLKGPGWMWDDDPDDYQMSVSVMMMNYNVLRAKAAWDGKSMSITLTPAMKRPYVFLQKQEPGTKTALEITRTPFTDSFEVRGSTSAEAGETTRALTMHEPDLWVAEVLSAMLEDQGIAVGGESGTSPHSDDKIVAEIESKTLAEMVTRFNKVSENAIGEMLIHHFAIAGGATQGNWPGGAKFITNWLREKPALDEGDFRIVDGSGLSRYDLVCARGTVKLLRWMTTHRDFKVYKDSFPVYGAKLRDGRSVKTIHAKPGGMAAVNTIAGYVDRADGSTLVFAVFQNGYVDEKPVIALRKAILQELAQ
ncbi:MAG TPA: D-alanyl-D-alanine carboxypeptidase/D-alanyl-D-alanine-endopeptidase [Candidatus Sumerlaeota bacterium]|nr:D-alanyl-D-alanine carboxypeptidase/D-alanyl-D-alanine-endopeptidase [Candidatus Sumerlaeota bacterium]